MPKAPNLLKAFEKGEIREIDLTGAVPSKTPPNGKCWLILDGIINFVTGTDTYLAITDREEATAQKIKALINYIWATVASCLCPLFLNAVLSAAGATPAATLFVYGGFLQFSVLFSNTDWLRLSGDPTATASIRVLEWIP